MASASAESVAAVPREAAGASSGWLFGPWIDLLFVANIAWPLLLLAELWGGFEAREGLVFWQVYFVTTPHRWATLGLVFLDGERFREQSGAFLGILAAVVLFCLGVRFSTGTLTCLLTIDYIWNAWHFAAQHHGIYRIYGRVAQQPMPHPGLEKWGMRVFLVYVAVRVAGWSWAMPAVDTWLQRLDWAMLLIPAWLLVRDLADFRRASFGRVVYLLSVCGVYLGMWWSVHDRRPGLLLMFTTVSALFHATEYLAIVTWAVRRKHGRRNSESVLGRLAARWGLTLATFIVVLGVGAWSLRAQALEAWLLVNVVVAYLHYAYDGMIWKSRRKASYGT